MKQIILLISIFMLSAISFAQTVTTDEGVEINGLIWATRNVGMPNTFVDNPEDLGMLFQWNYALGYSSTDPLTTSDGGTVWYRPGVYGSEKVFTNDVCPAGWHTPSFEEMEKLLDTDNKENVTINGINCKKFIDKNNPDKFIYLPAAGKRETNYGTLEGYQTSPSMFGNYWSSTKVGIYNAYSLGFITMDIDQFNITTLDFGHFRQYALSVRCVKEKDINTSINEISSEQEKNIVGYYSILGQKLPKEPTSGIFIILYDNGESEKRIK